MEDTSRLRLSSATSKTTLRQNIQSHYHLPQSRLFNLPTSHTTPSSTLRALTSSRRYTRRAIAPIPSSPAKVPSISTTHPSRQPNTLRSLSPKQLWRPIKSWCVGIIHAGEGAVAAACWELYTVSLPPSCCSHLQGGRGEVGREKEGGKRKCLI